MDNVPERQQSELPDDGQVTVHLSGCVAGAPGSGQYVLRDVQFMPDQPLSPHRDTTTDHVPNSAEARETLGITQGSYVRLEAGDQDDQVKALAGQHVTVIGSVVDHGRNTIGTAGSYGAPREGGLPSQAASPDTHWSDDVKKERGRIGRESMADGTAALVRVTEIQGTGDQCAADLVPSVR